MENKNDRKPANQVLGEALDFFMGDYWSNVSLARASGVAEGTIRNYRNPAKRDQGASGKPPSAKLAELEQIADAMGLRVVDLLQDLSEPERAELRLRRAAEHYQRTGSLPAWAPGATPATAAPAQAQAGKELTPGAVLRQMMLDATGGAQPHQAVVDPPRSSRRPRRLPAKVGKK